MPDKSISESLWEEWLANPCIETAIVISDYFYDIGEDDEQGDIWLLVAECLCYPVSPNRKQITDGIQFHYRFNFVVMPDRLNKALEYLEKTTVYKVFRNSVDVRRTSTFSEERRGITVHKNDKDGWNIGPNSFIRIKELEDIHPRLQWISETCNANSKGGFSELKNEILPN